jgi:hypothetical protein
MNTHSRFDISGHVCSVTDVMRVCGIQFGPETPAAPRRAGQSSKPHIRIRFPTPLGMSKSGTWRPPVAKAKFVPTMMYKTIYIDSIEHFRRR